MFRYTKLVLLLPHAVGVCSACHDLQQSDRIYNSVRINENSIRAKICFLVLVVLCEQMV